MYLLEGLEKKHLHAPIAILAEEQYAGLGSRDNNWIGAKGGFFLSMAIGLEDLPKDLPLGSASIYFSYIMKEVLSKRGVSVWLKWPNDFYKEEEKVGGTLTKLVGDVLVCGMGINLRHSPEGYASLKEELSAKILLEYYLEALQKFPTWKQVFSAFEIEFCLSRKFSTHNKQNKISLKNAILCKDGSLLIEGRKVYSLR